MPNTLTLLNQISDELNKDLDLDNMLQRVIDLTVGHFKASKGSIMLFDERNRVSKFILQNQNVSDDRAQQIVGEVLTEGFAGWVLKNGRGDIIHDTLEDDRWYIYPNQPYTARSVIATPLTRRKRVLGVLTINHKEPAHFHPNDLPLLNAIAGQAAIALENAQLFHQTELERAKLSAIINSTTDLVLVTAENSQQVQLLNPAAEAALDVQGQSWQDAPLKELTDLEALLTLLEHDHPEDYEVLLPDGRTFSANVIDVPNVGRLALMHDITALKALDQMKTDFITTFTHDLAAPLAAIKGYLELIETERNLSQQQLEDLGAIRLAVQQMRTLIRDLLDLTRIENIKNLMTVPLALNKTLTRSQETFTPIAEAKQISLTCHLNNQPLIIEANSALIARAVDNLIENAIKYTEARGQVTVSLHQEAEQAQLTVQDTGLGIPEKGLPHIFDKFFRAHAVGADEIPGSGLGLSIVKTIIERHGGTISVVSQVGQGSTFTVHLPLKTMPTNGVS